VTPMPMTDGHSMYTLCRQAPVIPVLVIDDLSHAAPLATALVAGGLPVIEVTLRTPVALDAISIMRRVAGATVGAGSVITPDNAAAAQRAGAQFAVSPGWTHPLIDACETIAMPLLPGAATAAEAMMLYQRGYDMLKFFPAQAAGGVAALRALSGPLPQIRFCPTGGITADTAADFLALPNVVCIGGSWIAPKTLIGEERWGDIRNLAFAASHLAG
jgi:2-dehydro-3-deoxyphosphogluconate aldolase / (4S)-4-hydroxy-2-oxoglutarate aldolase